MIFLFSLILIILIHELGHFLAAKLFKCSVLEFAIFGFYSVIIGLSNALPVPALDGSYPIAFLFEKKYGKKKCYEKIKRLFEGWFKWLMILNILSLPYLIYIIYTGAIL